MTTIYLIGGAVVAIIAALFGAFTKGKRAGADAVAAKQAKDNGKTQSEFDKIDSAKPDLDGAIDRLRKRSAQ